MGQEIAQSCFSPEDFARFGERLEAETRLLGAWFAQGRFAEVDPTGGLELEIWLVDDRQEPAPGNEEVLQALRDPRVVEELARFNLEINSPPERLQGAALSRLQQGLTATFAACGRSAAGTGAGVVSVGILPTVRSEHLCLENMSRLRRYRALNEQVLRLRGGRPIHLHIQGRECIDERRNDVMLEAAATSLQIHFQVRQDLAVRVYNAAKVISAPMVAACANSPYLFGRDLWAETRIPLFEQAVAVGTGLGRVAPRVSFGQGYAVASLFECFENNRRRHAVLLPERFDAPPESLAHLRLHNGTIWRWNRPLVAVAEDGAGAGLRVEHRVASAPPSMVDAIADTALFFGLAYRLAREPVPPESRLSFAAARDNFYAAAREGLDAEFIWLDGARIQARELLARVLLPLARSGLEALALDAADRDLYLGVLRERFRRGVNGAVWQRAFVARHGPDMSALTAAYRDRQGTGLPVHEWSV